MHKNAPFQDCGPLQTKILPTPLAEAALLCVKWRHGRQPEIMSSYQKSEPKSVGGDHFKKLRLRRVKSDRDEI